MNTFRQIFQYMTLGHLKVRHFANNLLLNQVSHSLSENDGSLADPSLSSFSCGFLCFAWFPSTLIGSLRTLAIFPPKFHRFFCRKTRETGSFKSNLHEITKSVTIKPCFAVRFYQFLARDHSFYNAI